MGRQLWRCDNKSESLGKVQFEHTSPKLVLDQNSSDTSMVGGNLILLSWDLGNKKSLAQLLQFFVFAFLCVVITLSFSVWVQWQSCPDDCSLGGQEEWLYCSFNKGHCDRGLGWTFQQRACLVQLRRDVLQPQQQAKAFQRQQRFNLTILSQSHLQLSRK